MNRATMMTFPKIGYLMNGRNAFLTFALFLSEALSNHRPYAVVSNRPPAVAVQYGTARW